jgi:cold shock CspA family protein
MKNFEVGIVKWYGGFNKKKQTENKFGFIERIATSEDLFVREENLLCSPSDIEEEVIVVFELKEGFDNKINAVNVRLLDTMSEEDLRLCMASENDEIKMLGVEGLIGILGLIEVEIVDFLINKYIFPWGITSDYGLDSLVEKIPNKAFVDYPKLRLLLPVERHIKITTDLINNATEHSIIRELALELKRNINSKLSSRGFYLKEPIFWTSVFRDGVIQERIPSGDTTQVWDIIPLNILAIDELWEIVPVPKKYSLLTDKINNPFEGREGKFQAFKLLIETVKTAGEHELLPDYIKRNKHLFPLLNGREQVKVAWNELTYFWDSMNLSAKIYSAFRAVKERRNLFIKNFYINEANPLVKGVLLLLGSGNLEESMRIFQQHVEKVAWESTEPLDLYPLLAGCPKLDKLNYCEARRWKTPEGSWKIDKQGRELAFCPRTQSACNVAITRDLEGARVVGLTNISWEHWTLTELLAALDIKALSPGINSNDTYLLKFAGWINRLNEIRSRMKCEVCTKTLIPTKRYAYHPARYNSTVAHCPDGHGGVYFNHCSNCERIIDSRESRVKEGKYYICIHCGSIPAFSHTWESLNGQVPMVIDTTFKQGDKCPKCGTSNMDETANREVKKCRNKACEHRIHLKGRKDRYRNIKYI